MHTGDPTTQSTTSCVSSHKIGDSCINVEVKPGEGKEVRCSSVCRPAEVEGHNGGGATPLEDKLDTRGQVSGISTDGKRNLTSPSMVRNKSFLCDHEEIRDGSLCTSNIKIGDGSDCTAASGRKLQKLLVEDPLSGPVVKEELGSASATDQQQLPSLDAVDESVVAVVSLAADNVPSPKAVDESMTRKSENSGIDYFKLGDEAREKNSIPTSSIDEPVGSATVSLVTAAIASEVKEVHESYPVGSKGQEPPSTSMIKEIENVKNLLAITLRHLGSTEIEGASLHHLQSHAHRVFLLSQMLSVSLNLI
ncbi:alpha-mannosidase I [Musa troglodytarum]|uniref:Alpha-mannosidase I n=1 Tax=Musa troglodytarum TaxID=320322 RepID=A0A9E7I965_9LILI|nr:alpha-mannosidase I [Musa troglodytarum]